jgi:hypothetical protein
MKIKGTWQSCSIFVFLVFILSSVPGKAQKEIPATFCISSEENKLYDLVNEYRKSFKLPAISLSNSLCYVGKKHLQDLLQNQPDTNNCNLHSWSDKGSWSACCFWHNKEDKKCMQSKPAEITNYMSEGYEIIFWESREATAEAAFKQFREIAASQSVLINSENWESYNWNALGVAIQGQLACIWFGEEPDVEKETKVCGKNIVIANTPTSDPDEPQIVATASSRFYIIYGSFNSIKDARIAAKEYLKAGFKKTKIISKDNKFRISLSDYANREQANAGKKELPAKYKDAWIMAY